MRKLILGVFVLVPVLLIVGIKSRMITQSRTAPMEVHKQEGADSPLTEAEESDLRKLTPQALTWVLIWNTKPTNCLQNGEVVILDLAKEYQRYEGQEVEMRLVIHGTDLAVELAPLHVYLSFARLHDFGLGPPNIIYFCETSYEEHITAESRRAKQMRKTGKEIVKRAEDDPQMARMIEELRAKRGQLTTLDMHREEVRSYKARPLAEQPVEPLDSWSQEKKAIYERVAAMARKEVEEIYCESGKTATVTIPDFDVGDPSIYLLVEPASPHKSSIDEASIFWIRFVRDSSTGEYDALLVKSLGLPDELHRFAPIIKNRQARQLKLVCPIKRFR